jgi:hypothetical protein
MNCRPSSRSHAERWPATNMSSQPTTSRRARSAGQPRKRATSVDPRLGSGSYRAQRRQGLGRRLRPDEIGEAPGATVKKSRDADGVVVPPGEMCGCARPTPVFRPSCESRPHGVQSHVARRRRQAPVRPSPPSRSAPFKRWPVTPEPRVDGRRVTPMLSPSARPSASSRSGTKMR